MTMTNSREREEVTHRWHIGRRWTLAAIAALTLLALALPAHSFVPPPGPAYKALEVESPAPAPAAGTARKQAAPPAAAATAAVRSAEALAGTRASRAPVLQLFTDLDLTSQADHRLVWRIDFDRFQVPQPDGLAPAALDLHLVCDAATGAPISAYSTAGATSWPKAQLPQEGAFAHRLADVATITPALAPTLPQSPLAQILTAAWSAGVSMISSQQVIARFCNAVTPLPARRVGADLVPLRAPGPAWLVSGIGLQAPFEAEQYDTQTHVLVDDATATCVLGFRSP